MRKICGLFFIIVLMVTLGFISDAKAVVNIGEIPIVRNIKNIHNLPVNTFTYEIKQDPNNPVQVTGFPTSATISQFEDIVSTSQHFGEKTGWYDAVASGSTTIDFSGVTFTQPGDYGFYVTEESSSIPSQYPVDQNTVGYIVISVRNRVDGDNIPTGELTDPVVSLEAGSGKAQELVFQGDSYISDSRMIIGNEVRGNMANPDEYFKITLNVECPSNFPCSGAECITTHLNAYLVYYEDSEGSAQRYIQYNGNTIDRTPFYDTETGEYFALVDSCSPDRQVGDDTIYLKHGEAITIYGIQHGATYSFTEDNPNGYYPYINGRRSENLSNPNQSGPIEYGTASLEQECENGISLIASSFYHAISPNVNGAESFCSCVPNSQYYNQGFDHPSDPVCSCKSGVDNTNCTMPINFRLSKYDNVIVNVKGEMVPTGVSFKYIPYAIAIFVAIAGSVVFIVVRKKRKKADLEE